LRQVLHGLKKKIVKNFPHLWLKNFLMCPKPVSRIFVTYGMLSDEWLQQIRD
jgi:hypothetical protein